MIVAHLGSGASLCAMKDGKSVDSTLGIHRARRTVHGHPAWRARPRRRPLPVPGPGPLGQGSRDDPLQEVGPARHLRHQQRHARRCSAAPSRQRGWRSNTSSTAPRRRSARSRRCLAASTALVFTAGIGENSAEIRRRICEASAWLGVELDRGRTAGRRDRASRAADSRVSVWVIPTNEELMIARHTGRLLGVIPAQTGQAVRASARSTSWQ